MAAIDDGEAMLYRLDSLLREFGSFEVSLQNMLQQEQRVKRELELRTEQCVRAKEQLAAVVELVEYARQNVERSKHGLALLQRRGEELQADQRHEATILSANLDSAQCSESSKSCPPEQTMASNLSDRRKKWQEEKRKYEEQCQHVQRQLQQCHSMKEKALREHQIAQRAYEQTIFSVNQKNDRQREATKSVNTAVENLEAETERKLQLIQSGAEGDAEGKAVEEVNTPRIEQYKRHLLMLQVIAV